MGPGKHYGELPTVMRVIVDGAPGPDSYAICNACGRRWLVRTTVGYPDDAETVRTEVTGDVEVDRLFVMDATTELSLAAQRGDCEAVRVILDSGPSIEQRSHVWELPATPSRIHPLVAGGTALMAAVYFAREECVELLLERGADPSALSVDHQTPLNIAVRLGTTRNYTSWGPTLSIPVPPQLAAKPPEGAELRIVDLLLRKGAEPHADGALALFIATHREHTALIRLLLRAAPAPAAGLVDALHEAVIRGDLKNARELLAQGADVNAKGRMGEPALVASVSDVHVLGDVGTPLREVTDHRRELAELALAHGADVSARGREGMTSLMQAAWGKDASHLVELLIGHGADVNAVNKHGETALIKAAARGCVESVEVLLRHGADADARDTWGRTALDVADAFGSREAAALLRSRKS